MSTVSPYRLTTDERRRLARDGYILREGVFDAGEVARITAACESLVDEVVKDPEERRVTAGSYVFDRDPTRNVTIKWEGSSDVVHGIEPFAHLQPELEKWAYDARFVEPMVDVVGDPEPTLFTEKLNLKRPRHGGINPLHQDYPYWERLAEDATRIATAMLFLDEASSENGTLQVVPSSHARGKWPTRTDKDPFGQPGDRPHRGTRDHRPTPRGARRLGGVLRAVPRAQVGRQPIRQGTTKPALQLSAGGIRPRA